MSDLAASRQTPPRPDELELSLFGSGIGESLAIHLGNGEWAIVDSCLGDRRRAVALSYLESLAIDIATQVKLVVITQ